MICWQAIASHLADRSTPCSVLDRDTKVRLLSGSLESMLGIPREEVEGRPWSEALVAPAARELTQHRLERALSGSLRTFDSEAVARDGRRLRLSLEASLVGRGAEQALLVTVTSATPLSDVPMETDADHVEYEISSSLSDFGRLLAFHVGGRAPGTVTPTMRCYDVMAERSSPCPDCPVLRDSGEAWPRTVARRLRADRRGYEVVTADAEGGHVRVKLRRLPEETVAAIHESKVRDLSDAANLSERERSVLTYLLMGRSLVDIGKILQISPRTVKFHQANVLEKLGADSRADLIRLVT